MGILLDNFGAKSLRANEPQASMVEDAVGCELVSKPNSLLTGKLTGNFAESGHPRRFPHLINELIQRLASQIPYATEQGIFAAITGNFGLHPRG